MQRVYDATREVIYAMDSETEVTGVYVNAFLESAGEVSPVFEQRLRSVLDDHGISDPVPEEWYPAQQFVDAVTEVSNTIGDQVILQAGVDMGKNVPWADEVSDDPGDVLEYVARTADEAYRNSTEEYPIGQYQIETVESGRAVVAVTEKWPYPKEVVQGAIKGALKVSSDRVERATVTTIDANVNQAARFEITW